MEDRIVPAAPVAFNDGTYSVVHGQILNVPANGVLANDTDADNDTLTAIQVSYPSHGYGVVNSNGSVSYYTTSPGYVGPDSFTYKANDGANDSNTVTVTINVTSANSAPVASDDQFMTPHGQALDLQSDQGVLANDQDFDFDLLSTLVVQGLQHGTLTLDADGGLLYTPTLLHIGYDSFTYRAFDGVAESNVATVVVNTTDVVPDARDDSYHVDAPTTLSVGADWGVLANDTDPDDALTATLLSGPQYGSLILNADGSFEYTPSANFPGEDSFVYRATDPVSTMCPTTVYLTSGVAARDDAYQVDHHQTLNVALDLGVLANDDVLDPAPTVSRLTDPMHGSVTLNSDGSFVYIPYSSSPTYIGSDQFTYQINASGSTRTTAIAKIEIYNIAPVGASDSYAVAENTPLNVGVQTGVLANDFDAENNTRFATLKQAPRHGNLQLNADGSLIYTPNPGFRGIDHASYVLSDGASLSDSPVPVQFLVAELMAAPLTVSGIIMYDSALNLRVRSALVVLEGHWLGFWYEVDRTMSDNIGSYSLGVSNPSDYGSFRLTVYAETPASAFGTHVVWVGRSPAQAHYNRTYLGAIANNIVHMISIGNTRIDEKAFWTFDAAVTANRAFAGIVDPQSPPYVRGHILHVRIRKPRARPRANPVKHG